MTRLQASIIELVKAHPVPADHELDNYLSSLDRMEKFYEDKAQIAPRKQSVMFMRFATALRQTSRMVKKYRELTAQVSDLTEVNDETGPSS